MEVSMWNDKYTKELNKLFKDWEKEVEKVNQKYKDQHEEIAVRFRKEKEKSTGGLYNRDG